MRKREREEKNSKRPDKEFLTGFVGIMRAWNCCCPLDLVTARRHNSWLPVRIPYTPFDI